MKKIKTWQERSVSLSGTTPVVGIETQRLMQQEINELRDAFIDNEGVCVVPTEVVDLFNFMVTAFVPVTSQQEQIKISLDVAKKAMEALN